MGKQDESAGAAGTTAPADSPGGEASAAGDGAGTDAGGTASVPAPRPTLARASAAAPSEPAAAASRQQQAQTGSAGAAVPQALAANAAAAAAGDAALRAASPATSAPAPPAKPHEAVPAKKPADEFDPMGWEVPVICKDCDKGFKVPYRHFQVGVVFHCPHCHGSYVPKMTMHQMVRDTFETFYGRRKREREEFARSGGNEAAFKRKQEKELEEFHKRLDRLAHEMRPAGKLVRPKGIGAMFT